jgi:hypothetical protein
MQEAKQTFPGNADGEDDHLREIVVKGTVKREEDENSLVDIIVILGFTSVFGVSFLIGGVSGLYVASTGSGSDGDLFFSWGLPSLSTLIGAFFSLVTVALVLLSLEDRRLQTSDTVARDTPPDDPEDWWDPKSRLEWGEVDLVIKNSTAGVIRGGLLLAVAVAIMVIPPFVGFAVLVLVVELDIAAFMVGQVDQLGEVLFSVQLLVSTFTFLACFLAIPFYAVHVFFAGALRRQVKCVLASRGGVMEIHYVGWRGLVDVVHLEASEITAVHQTTHPSWAGPPSDAFIIAGWDVLRVPLHGNAGRLCELLGLELRKTAPNLADLYVKQGDMSGSRPREALQDADFEGYRDRKRPYGAFFLSTFVWFFILILSGFLGLALGSDAGALLATGLGLWVIWRMFSWSFRRPVLRVLHTKGSLVVEGVSFGRVGPREGWPIAEASHIVVGGERPPSGTNREWFTLVGVNSREGKWGPAWEYDLEYLLPQRARGGDVVEEGSVAMGIAMGIAGAIGIPIVTRPYEKMKFQQLKEEARGRGLEVGRRKADLVARLYESDAMARQL